MEVIQSFRLSGTTDVKEIPCDQVNGQNVIYWEDIKEAFPGLQYVSHGNTTIMRLRDSEENRIEPHRIKYHPDVVLDVVLDATCRNGSVEPSMSYAAPSPISQTKASAIQVTEDDLENLQVAQAEITLNNNNDTRSLPSTVESEADQQLVTTLPSEVQVQGCDSTHIRDAPAQVIRDDLVVQPDEQLVACLQELRGEVSKNNELASNNKELASRILDLVSENNGLTTQVINLQETLNDKQDEMQQLPTQVFDRLALLQNSVNALMNQTIGLHEHLIPRLFIVLPHDSLTWDPLDPLSNNFRLYFLCECGEHTKSADSKIPHHIHLANHEGYDVARPKEFFQRYGSYALTILQMLKFGIAVTGVAIPALSQLIRTDAMDQAIESLKVLTNALEPGMDQVISYIEKVSEDEGEIARGFSEHMANNEASEGVDLRQLKTFLKTDGKNNVLGDLYRTATTKGNVKWVCIDHYRENYHAKTARAFRYMVEGMIGQYDENIGRVVVRLNSKLQAEEFYLALEKAKSVYELDIRFYWIMTQGEHKRLRDVLAKTNVGVLRLYLWNGDIPTTDILDSDRRYDPILGIMRLPFIKSVTLKDTSPYFIQRSSLQSRKSGFPNLKHLDISVLFLKDDISGLKSLVAKTANLSSLTITDDDGHFPQIYNAIAEHQTYPIIFKAQSLCVPPPKRDPGQPMAAHDYMVHLFKIHGKLELGEIELDEPTLNTLAKATQNGLQLKVLELTTTNQLSDSFIKDIASIAAQSKLRKLQVWTREDKRRLSILESIQWKHLRGLEIRMKRESFETRVMKALADGAKEVSGRIELDEFSFHSEDDSHGSLAMPEDGPLEAFLSSTSLKKLLLGVDMTLEQTLSLLKSVDLSRMEDLNLWTQGFGSAEVDAVLECLENATELSFIGLRHAKFTETQKWRVMKKGIKLSTVWNR